MKRTLFSIALLCSVLCSQAGEPGEPALAVTTKDGKTAVYALREKPLVTFSGDDVVLKTPNVQISYVFADLESFMIVNNYDGEEIIRRLPADDIRNLPADATQFEVTDKSLIAGNLNPGEELLLFTVDGKRIASARASEEGRASVSLESIPTGVVIVKTQSFTYKIQKQ